MAHKSSASLTKTFVQLAKQCSNGVFSKHQHSPVKFRSVIQAGFPYEAFNARGVLHPMGVLKLLERARITGFWAQDYEQLSKEKAKLENLGHSSEQPFIDMNKLENLIYMASTSLQIEPKVYDYETEKQPIMVDLELDYIGNTSFKLKNSMYFPGQPEPLIQSEMQVVFIDPQTKKPSPPAQWWLDKFRPHVSKSSKPLILEKTQIPKDIQVEEEDVLVTPSDVDAYLHLSSSHYIKFVVDSYICWHIKKYGYERNGDPFRNLKSMSQSFLGEAAAGDLLKVKFWPSKDNENLFHFHILKDQNLIHECIAEFYPLHVPSNL